MLFGGALMHDFLICSFVIYNLCVLALLQVRLKSLASSAGRTWT